MEFKPGEHDIGESWHGEEAEIMALDMADSLNGAYQRGFAEIPAWQPIATARQFGKPIMLGRQGESTQGRWTGGAFRADRIEVQGSPPWTHWQPLPEAPGSEEA